MLSNIYLHTSIVVVLYNFTVYLPNTYVYDFRFERRYTYKNLAISIHANATQIHCLIGFTYNKLLL